MHIKFFAIFIPLVIFLSGCISDGAVRLANYQHTVDENRCKGYGYKIESDKFADCMMQLDQQRREAALAEKNRKIVENDHKEYLKSLSIKRNGDERYPVCRPTMPNVELDVPNHSWYGPNCREK